MRERYAVRVMWLVPSTGESRRAPTVRIPREIAEQIGRGSVLYLEVAEPEAPE